MRFVKIYRQENEKLKLVSTSFCFAAIIKKVFIFVFEWNKIEPEILENLIESMSRKVQAEATMTQNNVKPWVKHLSVSVKELNRECAIQLHHYNYISQDGIDKGIIHESRISYYQMDLSDKLRLHFDQLENLRKNENHLKMTIKFEKGNLRYRAFIWGIENSRRRKDSTL
ncbi:hypothetical protein Glove_233g37 [Diversispora epigaea]|uniref:Uncharacterized protein n=1 Tax=Diversispora epigaea TaxID=1348612 RepID=A0A397IJ35_9GLOM|nr:hypothetical protein Glove_233g37 [Diversispora epigaea]